MPANGWRTTWPVNNHKAFWRGQEWRIVKASYASISTNVPRVAQRFIWVGEKPHKHDRVELHYENTDGTLKLPDGLKEMLVKINLDVERDFTDIRDFAAMYELLVNTGEKIDVIHFCSNEVHSIREIVSCLVKISRRRIEIVKNDAFVRPNDLLYQRGSDRRLLSLGFRRQHSLDQTLEWMYEDGLRNRETGVKNA